MLKLHWICMCAALLAACNNRDIGTAEFSTPPAEAAAEIPVSAVELGNTEELFVKDAAAGREYPVWVALPNDYAKNAERHYPVLYVTDALYSFPLVRSIRNLVGQGGVNIEDFILVGLPPQVGLTSKQSRSRDYTPTSPANHNAGKYSAEEYGGAAHYRDFIEASVFPQIESRYRVDAKRRAFAGHSYGGLFGSYILLTKPDMFTAYVLSSPSLWYDGHYMQKVEAEYAASHDDLKANVLFFIGQYETQGPEPRYFRSNDMVGDNRRMVEKLKDRAYPGLKVDASVIGGEDHFTVYPTVITRALLALFPGSGPYSSG